MNKTKIDLTLPIFKHWNKIFHNYKYKLINIYYYSSNYSEDSVYMVGALKEMVLKLNSGRI